MRRHHSICGDVIVVYLLVSIHEDSEQNTAFKPFPKQSQRSAFLLSLHECIELSLTPIPVCAYNALQFLTKSCTNTLSYFFISCYVADIPITEDLPVVKRDSPTRVSCHACLIEKERSGVMAVIP